MCPTPSTWCRPNHEEPRRSDTFRSGNGKSLWQLWLLFTRMPCSAHLTVHLAELAFFLKVLAKATCALGSFCTSVSSAPLAFHASCLTCNSRSQPPLNVRCLYPKASISFRAWWSLKKKNHKMLGA